MTSEREKREKSVSELDENQKELGIILHQPDLDPFPSSLLTYFETSRSRAAACEKLLLEDLDDERVESQTVFLPESSNKEEEMSWNEDLEMGERRQQREEDFQRELRKIIEAEKMHQMELELSLKRAHDAFEEELQVQQKHFGDLHKRVEHERRIIEEQLKISKEEDQEKKKNNGEKKQKEEVNKGNRQEFEEEDVDMQRQEEGGKEKTNKKWREDEDVVKKKSENGKNWMDNEVKRKEANINQQVQSMEKKRRKEEAEEERKKNEESHRERVINKKIAEKEDEGELLEVAKEVYIKGEEGKIESQFGLKDELRTVEEEKKKRGDAEKREKPGRKVRQEEEMEEVKSEEMETDLKMLNKSFERKHEKTTEETTEKKKLCESEEKREDEEKRQEEESQNIKEKLTNKQVNEEKKVILQENKEQENTEDVRFEQDVDEDNQDKQKRRDERRSDDDENMLKDKRPQEKSKNVDVNEYEKGKVEEETLQKEVKRVIMTNGGRDVKEDINKVMMTIETELQQDKGKNKSLDPTNNVTSGSSMTGLVGSKTLQQCLLEKETASAAEACAPCWSVLAEHTEQKRLSWRKDCISWSTLSLQNSSRPEGSVQTQRRHTRKAETDRLPPLCTDALLQAAGRRPLQEVTTVTLENLPRCSVSSLVQCPQLRSLTLRRCGLRALEGIKQLQKLCYVDLRENDISYVDCNNMTSLRVLRLGHNKLTSIHGLSGAENLDVLDLSYNSITRVAGLESLQRLQRLSLDHNQLINTRGLKDVYTLLHLSCANNHLEAVEGLESSALLHTLDLRANCLTEAKHIIWQQKANLLSIAYVFRFQPPSLNNQVLLRELHLDNNCISSLQGLTDYWLPLLQNLSVSQNQITQLPSMTDFISLEKLDLRFNCLSEVLNMNENLQRCHFLGEVWLSGNPVLQERGWSCVLQKAVPGLRAIDGQQTDSFMSASAATQVSCAPGSFLTICREQLQQTQDLQKLHSTDLSNASLHLDAVERLCQHHTLALKLAEEQRLFHEYADANPAHSEKTLYTDSTATEKCYPEEKPSHKTITQNRDVIKGSSAFEDKAVEGRRHNTSKGVNCGILFTSEKSSVPTLHTSDLKRSAAVVIQQNWRKYRQQRKNTNAIGDDDKEELQHVSNNNREVIAATVIQAFWRGFTLRKKLASALAAVECPDEEDDIFEEVEDFLFDEPNLDKYWTDFEDSSPRDCPVAEPKPASYSLSSSISSRTWSPMQAWTAGENGDSASQKNFQPETSNRSKSPPSTFAASGVSESSERILEEWGFTDRKTAILMLKRAQRMKCTKGEEKKQKNPSVGLELFRNQLGPVEAQSRPAQLSQCPSKVSATKLGLQQLKRTEPRGHMLSQSGHFLPEMNSSILTGGRVQLTADLAYAEPCNTGALCASSSSSELHSKANTHLHKSFWDHSSKDVPSAKRSMSAPSKKERISFRDSPVHQSGGWGGGKKRGRLHK